MPDRDAYNRYVEPRCQNASRYLHEFEVSLPSTHECASYIDGLLREDRALRDAVVACVDTMTTTLQMAQAELERIVRAADSPYVQVAADLVLVYLSDRGVDGKSIPDGIEQDVARLTILADVLCEIMRSAASPVRLQRTIGKPGSKERQQRLNNFEANLDALHRSPELAEIVRRLLQDANDLYEYPPSKRRTPRPSQEEFVYAALPM